MSHPENVIETPMISACCYFIIVKLPVGYSFFGSDRGREDTAM